MAPGSSPLLLSRCYIMVAGLLCRWLCIENKFQQRTNDKSGRKVGWQVVMQEELASHSIEGDIMCGPCEEEKASRVIKA